MLRYDTNNLTSCGLMADHEAGESQTQPCSRSRLTGLVSHGRLKASGDAVLPQKSEKEPTEWSRMDRVNADIWHLIAPENAGTLYRTATASSA